MKRALPGPLPWLAGLLALYLIAPFVAGLGRIGGADWAGADWPSLGHATFVSVASATLATLLLALTAIPLGYVLARVPGRWMALLGFVVQLPLALPPLSSGVLLLFLLGDTRLRLTDSFGGIVLAEAFVAAPFLIIAARSAFARLDPTLEDVAATLGHRPLGVFRRVSLPIAGRAIIAGMLLAWMRAFGEFGATVMVAYHPYSLPVYTYVAFGSEGLPAMLPVLLPTIVAAFAIMAAAGLLGEGAPRRRTKARPIMPASPFIAELARTPRRGAIDFACRRDLAGFSLDVAWRSEARRLAILGASGSGKSMTLRLIAGIERERGRLVVDGRDLSRVPAPARGISYVPQSYALFPHLTVAEQLRFARDADAALAAHWLTRLDLDGLEARFPHQLSLGQQQRVALARALSRTAGLILLDEPFSALDAPLRARLRRALRELQDELDARTILVTHDPDEALFLADEILVLDRGRVLQAGSCARVYARPASEAVARLLGAEMSGAGWAVGRHTIDVGDGVALDIAGPALDMGGAVGWAVRPEAVRITPAGRYAGTIVDAADISGGLREVTVRLGASRLVARLGASEPVQPGGCHLEIDPASVQVWPAATASVQPATCSPLMIVETQP